MEKRKIIILSVLLSLTIGNYFRINNTAAIRTVDFLSIFVIGLLAGILIQVFIHAIRNKKQP